MPHVAGHCGVACVAPSMPGRGGGCPAQAIEHVHAIAAARLEAAKEVAALAAEAAKAAPRNSAAGSSAADFALEQVCSRGGVPRPSRGLLAAAEGHICVV